MPKVESIEAPEFMSQRDGEEVQFILFKHWFTLAAPIIKALFIILISLILPIWLGIMEFIFRYGILALVYYLWQVYWIFSMLYSYIRWYRARVIVTDQRVININQQGIFKRKVSEVELARVQNVTHEINGVFATLLNFGTVIIESASSSELTLASVGDPAGIQEEITRLTRFATRGSISYDTANDEEE